jgi:hypothetical protein
MEIELVRFDILPALIFLVPTHVLGVVGLVLVAMRMTALMPFFAVFTR